MRIEWTATLDDEEEDVRRVMKERIRDMNEGRPLSPPALATKLRGMKRRIVECLLREEKLEAKAAEMMDPLDERAKTESIDNSRFWDMYYRKLDHVGDTVDAKCGEVETERYYLELEIIIRDQRYYQNKNFDIARHADASAD